MKAFIFQNTGGLCRLTAAAVRVGLITAVWPGVGRWPTCELGMLMPACTVAK